MSLISAADGISSLCHSCEDWCLCAYKITYYFVHDMRPVLRMTWQTLCTDSEISTACSSTHAALCSNYSDNPTTRTLADVVTYLMGSSLQPSSLPTYRRAWRLYNTFSINILGRSACPLPLPLSNLAIFIAYLYQHNYASSTVNTYVSVLGYIHRLAGVADPTRVFFITEMLKGYGKVSRRFDTRLPITVSILERMCANCTLVLDSGYIACILKAMCSTAFYAFLRIGEITATKQAPDVIQLSQLTKLSNTSGFTASVNLSFHQFKHHYNQSPISIIISRQAGVCPVDNLLRYFSARGSVPGPLFQHLNGDSVTRAEFDEWLARIIKSCGLDSTRYKGHSFRIGAVSHAAARGYSDTQICLLGRWHSDAFKSYIRLPSLSYSSTTH